MIERTIILKARTYSLISRDWFKEWYKVTTKRSKGGSLTTEKWKVSERQAWRLIDSLGLVRALKNEDGEVYDTPDQGYRNDLGWTREEISRTRNLKF